MENLKFYMTPGSCSTGIHILLEELQLVFEAYIVNLPAGDQYKADFIAINPKSTIPVLVTQDGRSICDFTAIAYWLAKTYPKANLLGNSIDTHSAILETTNYIVNSIHMLGFTRIFTPDAYIFQQSDLERVKAQGETMINKGLNIVNRQLDGKRYLFDHFTIADAALFYVSFWADRTGMVIPDHCHNHYQNMLQRPAVKQVLMEEGYGAMFAPRNSQAQCSVAKNALAKA